MKWSVCLWLGLAVLAVMPGRVEAGAVDNNNTFSAAFMRTLNRNAATDAADIAVYNPAGIGFLQDGLYLNLNNMFMAKTSEHTLLDKTERPTYKADNATLFIPSAHLVYKNGKGAVFGTFTIPGGGGSLDYTQGIYQTASIGITDVVGASTYYGATLGAAFRVLPQLAIAGGARLVLVRNATTIAVAGNNILGKPVGTEILTVEEQANGLSGFIGLHFKPHRKVHLALRYDHQVTLEREVTRNDIFPLLESMNPYHPKGTRYRRDLPGVLGFGLAYFPVKALKLETSASLYLNRFATWEGGAGGTVVSGLEDKHNMGWEVGLGSEYTINRYFGLSAGALYTETGADTDSFYALRPALDNVLVGGGLFVRPGKHLQLDASATLPIYFDADLVTEKGEHLALHKTGFVVAVGMQIRAF